MHYTIAEVHKIVGGEYISGGELNLLDTIGFDSRRIFNAKSTLFFCIKSKLSNVDAFIAEAYSKGVRNFVTEKLPDVSAIKNANFILVPNALSALQNLAAEHRNTFTGPVVGITGSNGKTVVKEWLNFLLQSDFDIVRSPRSYNSGLGVAISLLGIEPENKLALIEAGISEPDDMEILQKMIRPNLGIFTHLGPAHNENFTTLLQKAKEKVKLFTDCDVIVYPYDSDEIRQAVAELKAEHPMIASITWGWKEGAKFRITAVELGTHSAQIKFIHRSVEHSLQIPLSDSASVENAMTCLCTLSALERWDPEHEQKFGKLFTLENRLVFYEGKNGNYIVNDSYSNDTDSLSVALDFLVRQQPDMPIIAILSDLEQSDKNKERLYKQVADILYEKGVKEFIGIGPELKLFEHLFYKINTAVFSNTEALMADGRLSEIREKAILVKGARSYKLESIAEFLRKHLHQTVLQIDLNALRNNFSFFRNKLSHGTKMMAMVKAFGYGSGSFEAAKTLQFMGADYLAVAYTDEGVALRNAGITIPIMVMNCAIADVGSLSEFNLEPVLFNKVGIDDFANSGYNLSVHIEIDTGMHRLGFGTENLENSFKEFPVQLKVKSVFSHLSASEAAEHDEFTLQQISKFKTACIEIEKTLGYAFIKHIANTGGILHFPGAHLDMVRLGIGLYGTDPSGIRNPGLETVATLKTCISQIKNIEAGDSVGYSRKAIENKVRRIATLPVGYADGLRRKLGNGSGGAMINGKHAPFVGNICMDMCMCDVTEIDCSEGQDAEIFGKQIFVETVAEQCETIAYEILTGVSQRVRREYVGEN